MFSSSDILETFPKTTNDYEYETFLNEPASFSRENVIAVVILLRVLVRMSKWREQVIKCKTLYHSAIGRGLNILQYK